ncbi:unnamed protein product [Prorocentrum cordatum]|uniref:EGF-like domain-containing protein n=1 Tax=Prorocentrum cordatum TaxID=2364126 RepID=A0ABN9RJC6_9DINO|nr:unnamed protein product [Polarella glacialis]
MRSLSAHLSWALCASLAMPPVSGTVNIPMLLPIGVIMPECDRSFAPETYQSLCGFKGKDCPTGGKCIADEESVRRALGVPNLGHCECSDGQNQTSCASSTSDSCECRPWTGGTCNGIKCYAIRGETECKWAPYYKGAVILSTWQCVCKPGFCGVPFTVEDGQAQLKIGGGKCVPCAASVVDDRGKQCSHAQWSAAATPRLAGSAEMELLACAGLAALAAAAAVGVVRGGMRATRSGSVQPLLAPGELQ